MSTYRVKYEVDVEAESALDAARNAAVQLAYSGKSEGRTPYALRAVYDVTGPKEQKSTIDFEFDQDCPSPTVYETVDAGVFECEVVRAGFSAKDYQLRADYAFAIELHSTNGIVMFEGTYVTLRRRLLEMLDDLDDAARER